MNAQEIVEYVLKEWSVISKAPGTLITLFVISLVLAYAAARWRYTAMIDNLRENLALETKRIEIKNEQIDDYRVRLGLETGPGSKYSRMSRQELQKSTFEFVSEVRKWLSEKQRQDMEAHDLHFEQVRRLPQAEAQKLWEENNKRTSAALRQAMQEYASKFQGTAVVLREELQSRLGITKINDPTSPGDQFLFKNPVNPIGITMVASQLQELAVKLL